MSASTQASAETRRPAQNAGLEWLAVPGLRFQVLADESGHLEHRDLLLAVEDLQQLVVCVDHPLVRLVLKAVGLDVVPHLFRDFAAGNWLAADDRGQVAARSYFRGKTFAGALLRCRH